MFNKIINYLLSLFRKKKRELSDSGIFYLYYYNKEEINNIWKNDKRLSMKDAVVEWKNRQNHKSCNKVRSRA